MEERQSFMDPNYVPDEYKVPYDVLELPSQGLLYPNKKSSVKVEYLTAYDENVLTSPNILASGRLIDVLIERKVKDLGFDHKLLLEGDRMAIVLFLRVSAFGENYVQPVIHPITKKVVEGEIDLTKLEPKHVTVDNNISTMIAPNQFEVTLPSTKRKIVFQLLTLQTIKESTLIMENKDSEYQQDPSIQLDPLQHPQHT